MSIATPLQSAIESVGLTRLARELGVTHQAVRKWAAAGRMPRTEWTGETTYSIRIESLTGGSVTRAQLLSRWPSAAVPADQPAPQKAAA